MPSRTRVPAPIVWAVTAIALALVMTGCGSGVKTRIGSPQSITATLPKPVKPSDTKYPEIGTRFVLPKLTKAQRKGPIMTYIRWNVAALTSLKAGKMQRRVKALSSTEVYGIVKAQVTKAGKGGGSWGSIVERIMQVQSSGSTASFGVCMTIAATSGTTTKQSLRIAMAHRNSGWYVNQFAAATTKLPKC